MPIDKIVVQGAREHNLKDVTVEIPRDRFVVLTGISGSGKSSLAFDTIYAEGQRKYVESLSAYARQFLGLMEKPDVDHIDGLSPAVSIDQKGAPRNPRSTVGTVTEVYDYLRLLYARVGQPHCPICGKPISRQTREQIVDKILALPAESRIQVLGPIVRGRKGEYRQLFEDLRRQGFARVRVDGIVYDLTEEIVLDKNKKHSIEVVVDRIVTRPDVKSRLADSLETALKLGQGIVFIDVLPQRENGPGKARPRARKAAPRKRAVQNPEEGLLIFSQLFACPDHGSVLPEIEPRIFSFNSPYGACPACSGLGFRQEFDTDLVLDWDKSLADGAVVPWAASTSEYYYELLQSLAAHYRVDMKTPLRRLSQAFTDVLLHGSTELIKVKYHNKWGALRVYETKFEGVLNQLQRRYKETDSEYMREEYEQYMTTLPCPTCRGARLKPESLSVRLGGRNIAQLTALTVRQALDFFNVLTLTEREKLIAHQILKEIKSRLGFLVNVG
ncbi:MAG TPA: excinuclease ABC subunit UvrA, partial [bacterium]|nr:excinuclease ABC subunit UvrA [bacterium]